MTRPISPEGIAVQDAVETVLVLAERPLSAKRVGEGTGLRGDEDGMVSRALDRLEAAGLAERVRFSTGRVFWRATPPLLRLAAASNAALDEMGVTL